MSTDPESTTASADVSPAGPSIEAEAPVGRDFINNFPPELLARILEEVRALCWHGWHRQRESQAFLRVCRSFHYAYLLSEAARECYINSTDQVEVLSTRIQHTSATEFRVDKIDMHCDPRWDYLPAYCKALVACQGSLRQLTWHGHGQMAPSEQSALVQAWLSCSGIQEFACFDIYILDTERLESLLAGWPHLTRLNLAGSALFLEDDYLASHPLANWQLPTKLRSFSLTAGDASMLLLLESIGRASSETLVDITVDFHYEPTAQALVESFAPVATSIKYLTLRDYDGYFEYSSVSALLASLPNLVHLQLPIEFIAAGAESRPPLVDASILQPLSKLRVLGLEHTDPFGWGDDLLVLLRGVKVPVLRLPRSWWDKKGRDGRLACEVEAAAKGIKLELIAKEEWWKT